MIRVCENVVIDIREVSFVTTIYRFVHQNKRVKYHYHMINPLLIAKAIRNYFSATTHNNVS